MADSIIIATYQHKHGSDVRAFATEEAAEAWRQAIAAENWRGGPDEDMPDCPEEAADRYFEFGNDIGDEWFSTECAPVEGAKPDPVRDAAPALLAALRAVLPYAESRFEDIVDEHTGLCCIDTPADVLNRSQASVNKAAAAINAAVAAIAAAEVRHG